jgi:hypothetical protein
MPTPRRRGNHVPLHLLACHCRVRGRCATCKTWHLRLGGTWPPLRLIRGGKA